MPYVRGLRGKHPCTHRAGLPEYEQTDMAIAQENIWMVLAIALTFSIFLSSSMIFFPNPIRRAMAMLI